MRKPLVWELSSGPDGITAFANLHGVAWFSIHRVLDGDHMGLWKYCIHMLPMVNNRFGYGIACTEEEAKLTCQATVDMNGHLFNRNRRSLCSC